MIYKAFQKYVMFQVCVLMSSLVNGEQFLSNNAISMEQRKIMKENVHWVIDYSEPMSPEEISKCLKGDEICMSKTLL